MVRRFLAGACAALALTLGACGAPPAVITPTAAVTAAPAAATAGAGDAPATPAAAAAATANDPAIEQAVRQKLKDAGMTGPYTIIVEAVVGDAARVQAIPADLAQVDPAWMFLKKQGDQWVVLAGPGTAFPPEDLTSVGLPATLAPATRTAIKLLQNIEGGSLRLVLPDGQHIMLGHGAERATLHVHDERVFRRVLAEGDIGFGESWIAGDWHSEQPAELLTLLAENREQLARAVHGSWLPVLGHRLRHLLRSNTRAGSKRKILAHYDLGNDFYKLWLDPSMSYSSALFGTDPQQSLQQAQRQKYLRLLEMLNPKPGDTILEVGCGWGGVAAPPPPR